MSSLGCSGLTEHVLVPLVVELVEPEPERAPPAPPAPPYPDDTLVSVSALYPRELGTDCARSGSPLCRLLERAGPVGALGDGTRVGLALPCRDRGSYATGSRMTAAARGDWSGAGVAVLRVEGDTLRLASLEARNAAEAADVAMVKEAVLDCFGSRPCTLALPAPLREQLGALDGPARTPIADARGHLLAEVPPREGFTWELGRSIVGGREWIVVVESMGPGPSLGCEWLVVLPLDPLAAEPTDVRR